jgi:hypothetical protein
MDDSINEIAGTAEKKFFHGDEERILLVYVPLLLISSIFFGSVFGEGYWLARVMELILVFGLCVCMYAWCRFDSDARGYDLHGKFVYAVVIFGHLALFYYLFRSRGFGGGALSILRYSIYIAVLLFVSFIVAAILLLPFEFFSGRPTLAPPRPA